jgi:hypothetical protein
MALQVFYNSIDSSFFSIWRWLCVFFSSLERTELIIDNFNKIILFSKVLKVRKFIYVSYKDFIEVQVIIFSFIGKAHHDIGVQSLNKVIMEFSVFLYSISLRSYFSYFYSYCVIDKIRGENDGFNGRRADRMEIGIFCSFE